MSAGPGADHLELIRRSPQASSITLPYSTAAEHCRDSVWANMIWSSKPRGNGGVQYHYDPSRPETVLARAEVDDALQTAAGRKDPVPASAVASSEPGSRYIDFLIPGLLGMNLMNSGMWGIGFALVDMRQRKLLKRFVGTPMRRSDFLLALISSRLVLMLIEIAILLGFGVLAFHMRVLGSLFTIVLLTTIGAISLEVWGCLPPAAPKKLRVSADYEPGDDADVDFFRSLFLFRTFSRHAAAGYQTAALDRAQ